MWQCKLLHSDSGFAEDNCVFATASPEEEGGEEIWVISRYEPDRTIQFVRFNRIRTIRTNITLSANNDRTTTAMWEQTITALDEAGNQFVAAYTDEKYRADVVRQEKLLNHFLQTGKALPPEKW